MRAVPLIAALSLLGSPAAAESLEREWVLVYYMSYDNNLEPAGRPILDMLRAGIGSPDIAVAVIADFSDRGMHRYVLTADGEKETLTKHEASADPAVLAAELAWVAEVLPAKHYALTFLNHGGRLGQMSQDQRPGVEGGPHWLYVPDVARVVREWKAALPGALELLFFQQCGKGTLENDYEMRDVAPTVMGSQTIVGAPNYYYTPALKQLSATPDITGLELATLFSEHETPNMFTTYTSVDTAAMADLPARLDGLLAPLLALSGPITFPVRKDDMITFSQQPGELFYDLLALLHKLYAAHDLPAASIEPFAVWMRETLLSAHRVSPDRKHAAAWSGLTVMVPAGKASLKPYADYDIYADTRLGELLGRLDLVMPPK